MAERFLIKSAADEYSLELRADKKEAWVAILSGPQVNVEAPVYGFRPHASFSGFFADLAENWRGWEGAKTYESLEHELRLSCAHDGSGHVTVVVEIQTDPMREWSVRGSLVVEPGQLGYLARRAAKFDAAS